MPPRVPFLGCCEDFAQARTRTPETRQGLVPALVGYAINWSEHLQAPEANILVGFIQIRLLRKWDEWGLFLDPTSSIWCTSLILIREVFSLLGFHNNSGFPGSCSGLLVGVYLAGVFTRYDRFFFLGLTR
jgi:hypothetical protein